MPACEAGQFSTPFNTRSLPYPSSTHGFARLAPFCDVRRFGPITNTCIDVGMRVDWKKEGKILVSDGGPGLAEALALLVEQAQRCHFHAAHDGGCKLWEDKTPLDERKAMRSRVAGLIGIEVPEKDFERVKEEDKAELIEMTENPRKNLMTLSRNL